MKAMLASGFLASLLVLSACSSGDSAQQALGLSESSEADSVIPTQDDGASEGTPAGESVSSEASPELVTERASEAEQSVATLEDPANEVSGFPGRDADQTRLRELCRIVNQRNGTNERGREFNRYSFDCPMRFRSAQQLCQQLDRDGFTWDSEVEAICGKQAKRVGNCIIEQGTSCVGADLRGADLTRAPLRNANFANANLEGAILSGADAVNANFNGANLNNAKIVNAQFYGANFRGAQMKGADFSGTEFSTATWIDGRRCNSGSTGGRCWQTILVDIAQQVR